MTHLSDIKIAQAKQVIHIKNIAKKLQVVEDDLEMYGKYKTLIDLKRIDRLGFSDFAICMAKTQKSFSDNEKLIGRPTGFTVTVREIEIAAGAQFLIPILGKMMRMPGLPSVPASENMKIDDQGVISGLS